MAKQRKVRKVRKIAGSQFNHKLCGTKSAIKAMADNYRSKGRKARVIKTGTRYCLYVR